MKESQTKRKQRKQQQQLQRRQQPNGLELSVKAESLSTWSREGYKAPSDELQQQIRPSVQELTFDPVPGVQAHHFHLYQPKDMFHCLQSKEVISFSFVNDDVCDCADGSDEPSTSACPSNRFYCGKITSTMRNWISSSKVNDGICDCCDGSDEYLNLGPPLVLTNSQIQVLKTSGMRVHHPPCPDVC